MIVIFLFSLFVQRQRMSRPEPKKPAFIQLYRPSDDPTLAFNEENCESFFKQVHSVFDEIEDIFSKEGVTRTALVLSMRFISLATHHSIKMFHSNSTNIYFHCASGECPVDMMERTSQQVRTFDEQQTESTGEGMVTLKSGAGPSRKQGCGFFLHFFQRKKRGQEIWVLKQDEWNSFGIGCEQSSEPLLCMNQEFLTLFFPRYLYVLPSLQITFKLKDVMSILDTFSLKPSKTTAKRSLKAALEIDEQSILEQDQQVEDYLQSLNRNGQYGVMLYSNHDLIVPSPDGSTCIKKSLILDNASRH